jgi:hypothetical protein
MEPHPNSPLPAVIVGVLGACVSLAIGASVSQDVGSIVLIAVFNGVAYLQLFGIGLLLWHFRAHDAEWLLLGGFVGATVALFVAWGPLYRQLAGSPHIGPFLVPIVASVAMVFGVGVAQVCLLLTARLR